KDKKLNIAEHMDKTLEVLPRQLNSMARHHPVIVGEWSLALDPLSLKGLNAVQREAAQRAYGAAQIIAYEQTAGWFYWSYKTEEGGVWSFRDMIEKGWLPGFI
ncbi:MAG: hypothetical protein JWP13_714, partial [Candidatus Saccharibacteria bacterium]|nr:hypothetical protein [Candidatus Saccharibacteria bacterium]